MIWRTLEKARGVMRPRQVAVVAVLCGTAALAVWGAAGLAGFASPDFENTSRLLVANRRAEPVASPQAIAVLKGDVSVGDVATVPVGVAIAAALADASPPEAPGVQMATAIMPDPVQEEAKQPASSIERLDECPVPEVCIDRY